jgi:cysteine-rich repeat protein
MSGGSVQGRGRTTYGRLRSALPVAAILGAFAVAACSDTSEGNGSAASDAGQPDASDAGTGLDASDAEPGPPPAGDTCADAIDANAHGTLDADGVLRLAATNVNARTDLEVCEPIPSAPGADVVVVYTPPVAGRLHWTLEPEDRNLFFVDLRSACEDGDSTLDCAQCACVSCSSPCERRRAVEAGVPLYFVVSGVPNTAVSSGMAGFVMGFALEPFLGPGDACDPGSTFPRCASELACQDEGGPTPVCGVEACGDGFLGFRSLDCEDGNLDDGDGCSSTCAVEEQTPGAGSCAQPATLHLPRTRLGSIVQYAIASGEMVTGTGAGISCAGGAGAEAGLAFELAAPSRLVIGTRDPDLVSVRREGSGACDGEELVCGGGDPALLGVELPELEAGRYVVVLHRDAAGAGATYQVEILASPP